MGWWPDPWGNLQYFEEELLSMLSDKIGEIGMWAREIYGSIKTTLRHEVDKIGQYLQNMGSSIGSYISGVLGDLIDDLDWLVDGIVDAIKGITSGIGDALAGAFDAVMEPVSSAIEYIGDILGDLGDWIYDGIAGGLSTVTEWVSGIWGEVKGFVSDQYDTITGFWSDMFADLYWWLDEALSEIWIYFVDVVIPAFMGALAYVFESEPVQWLVGLFEKHILSAFTDLVHIDKEDLEKWITDTFAYIKRLAEGVRE